MENKKSKFALSVGLLTGFGSMIASGCAITGAACSSTCVLPLLSFMGLSGTTLSGISWLAPWKTYLMVFSILVLGYAFWQIYKPKTKVACKTYNACECNPEKTSGNKIMLWLATAFCLCFYLYPVIVSKSSYSDGDSPQNGRFIAYSDTTIRLAGDGDTTKKNSCAAKTSCGQSCKQEKQAPNQKSSCKTSCDTTSSCKKPD